MPMNENESRRSFNLNKDEYLEECEEINIEGFIKQLEGEDITPKYELRIKTIDLQNSGLKEKLKEALLDD